MKFFTKYLDNDYQILNVRPTNLNYGIRHLDLNNEVPSYSKLIKYESISGTLYKNELNYKTPNLLIFINYIAVMRRFFLSNRSIKRLILIQKLAFKEMGIAIKNKNNIDSLYVYKFINKFAQIEIYMSNCEIGFLTEINYFDQKEGIEIKIPLNFEGIIYIFEKIFEDFYQFSMDELNIEGASEREKKLIKEIMQFDTKQIYLDDIDIYNIINGIFETNFLTNENKILKKEINYVINNDYIIDKINIDQNKDIIKMIFEKVDSKMTTPYVVKQFILEELHAASYGNEKAKEFVKASGFNEIDYIDAMSSKNSFDEVDGIGESQQTLLYLLMEYVGLSNRSKLTDIKLEIVDMFMQKYKLGKYEILPFVNKRFFLKKQQDNNYILDLYENYLVLINTLSQKQFKFDKVKPNKYYSKAYGYIEINKSEILKYAKDKETIKKFDIVKSEILTERNEFSHIYENDRAKEFLYIMEYTTKIETILEELGANGRGLHSKISSLENQLTDEIVFILRRIATIRNKKMHRKGFNNYIFSDFEDDCKIVLNYLENKLYD